MLTGIDILGRGKGGKAEARLLGKKLALLTHGAAVDHKGRSTLSVLRSLALDVALVLSPEHGLDGVAQAEEPVGKDDANVGEARLVSLYGSTKESLSPKDEDLAGIDVLVVDLVDVGSRYYTYVWTALLAAEKAASLGIHTMILDRPNPLSGDPEVVEGRPQDSHLCSFVGLKPLPIRHSMTIGEILATFFNQSDRALGLDGALSVVRVEGWERLRTGHAFGRPWVPPSPNMPSLETALVYPGGCLLEGTNLSEGRGTTTPFQLVGAPFLNGEKLAAEVGEVIGAYLRPVRFRPSFDKHAGKVCGGVMVHVDKPRIFESVDAYLRIIHAARSLAPDEFSFLTRVYEFEAEHPAFDLLTGTATARQLIGEGAPVGDVVGLVCPVDEESRAIVDAAEDLLLKYGS